MTNLVLSSLCSSQGQMKDVSRDLEDSRAAQKEVLASARESERRVKVLEADIAQLHEVRSHQLQQICRRAYFLCFTTNSLSVSPDVGSC